ncbi:GT2D2 protein, partial [Polyodon spathula]|nr:GT2D2 protein [Polyodon spathula]
EWEYLFVEQREKPVCLVFKGSLAMMKEFNLRRHYETKDTEKYGCLEREQWLQKMAEFLKNCMLKVTEAVCLDKKQVFVNISDPPTLVLISTRSKRLRIRKCTTTATLRPMTGLCRLWSEFPISMVPSMSHRVHVKYFLYVTRHCEMSFLATIIGTSVFILALKVSVATASAFPSLTSPTTPAPSASVSVSG